MIHVFMNVVLSVKDKGGTVLNRCGTCISFEQKSETCNTCGSMEKCGQKIMCYLNNEPEERFSDNPCGQWKRR